MKTNIINTPVADFTSVNTQERKDLNIKAGDTVKVHLKIKETNAKGKERTRIQVFEGLVLSKKHGNEAGATITVRKTTSGVGVERIFPVYSPIIDKIEIVKRGGVRKSKLYYIREKVAREIRRQMRRSSLVNISTLSDTEEQERLVKEKEESEKKAAEEQAAKEAEEKAKAEAETKKEEEVKTEEETGGADEVEKKED